MEFYLDIFHDFAKLEENVLGIYSGARFMIAGKVCVFNWTIVILESTIVIDGCEYVTNHVIHSRCLIPYLLSLVFWYPEVNNMLQPTDSLGCGISCLVDFF